MNLGIIFLFVAVVQGAKLNVSMSATHLPEKLLSSVKSYAAIFFRHAHCVLFAHRNMTSDSVIVSITSSLGKPIIAWRSLRKLQLTRFCDGLVILAQHRSAMVSLMGDAVSANWSFKVLALVQTTGRKVTDKLAFTQEELNLWRSYDILLIEFSPHKIHVRQYLIHQPFFQPTSLETLASDLVPHKLMNFNQRAMNVSAFSCPLFVIFKRKDGDGRPLHPKDIDGIEYRIFLEFANILNFKWNLIVPPGTDKWGMPRFKGEAPFGMIKMLIDRKIEMAICSWWLEVAKKKYIDLSTYWNSNCMTFLIRKPSPYLIQWTCFVRPFGVGLWIILILTTCLVAAVYWMNIDIQNRTFKSEISFGRSLLQIYGMLLMNDGYNPKGKGNRKFNRFLLTSWGIFTLNIISAYSGSLAARLTLPEFEPMLHTPEDLAQNNYILSAYYLSSWLGFTAQKYHLKLRMIRNSTEHKKLRRSAFFTKRVGDNFFMEMEALPENLLKDLRASRHCIEQYFITFAIPRGSGLGRHLNPIIRRLVESGITIHWLNRVFESQYTVFPFVQAYEYRQRIAMQVSLSFFYLQSAFLLWLFGCLASFVAFVAETYVKEKDELRIRSILRPDQTDNREVYEKTKDTFVLSSLNDSISFIKGVKIRTLATDPNKTETCLSAT